VVYGADAIRTGDLARIVDAVCLGPRRRGNVERCVGAGTIEEAVITADPIIPDDQAPIVDTLRGGEWARWIVEGGIGAILRVIEEAVPLEGGGRAGGDGVPSNDQACVVDVVCGGAAAGGGNVEGGVVID